MYFLHWTERFSLDAGHFVLLFYFFCRKFFFQISKNRFLVVLLNGDALKRLPNCSKVRFWPSLRGRLPATQERARVLNLFRRLALCAFLEPSFVWCFVWCEMPFPNAWRSFWKRPLSLMSQFCLCATMSDEISVKVDTIYWFNDDADDEFSSMLPELLAIAMQPALIVAMKFLSILSKQPLDWSASQAVLERPTYPTQHSSQNRHWSFVEFRKRTSL